MANNLPTTMEYFDTLLGEQLLGEDGGGSGGGGDFEIAEITLKVIFPTTDGHFDEFVGKTVQISMGAVPFINEEQNTLSVGMWDDIFGIVPSSGTFETVVKVPLYLGKLTVGMGSGNNIPNAGAYKESFDDAHFYFTDQFNIGGNISYSNNVATITGDGALTFNVTYS